jgi:hypothetical protein
MKKFLLPVFVVFVACGSDDGNSFLTENEQNLRGKWQLQSIMRNGTPYTIGECDNQNTVEFKNTGAYLQLNYGNETGSCAIDTVISGSYQFDNDSIFVVLNTQDTIRPSAILEVTPQSLRLNTRMYLADDEEGTDEVIFSRAN